MAFQPNKSTEDIALSFSENICQAFQIGSMTNITITDLASAYDTVWLDALYHKLIYKYGMDGNFIKYLMSYLSNRYNRGTYANYSTEWTNHSQGLPQGGPLSPILWTLFLNDYEILNDNQDFVSIGVFADDMTLMSSPVEYDPTPIKCLQSENDNLYNYACLNRLVLNPVKCHTLSLTRKDKWPARVFSINEETLDCVHHPHNAPDICKHMKRQDLKDLGKTFKGKTDQTLTIILLNKN